MRPKTYAEACEAVAGLEAATASPREVEALAHELPHPQAGEEDGGTIAATMATRRKDGARHPRRTRRDLRDADADRGGRGGRGTRRAAAAAEQLEAEAGVVRKSARWKDEELEEQQFIEAQMRRRHPPGNGPV